MQHTVSAVYDDPQIDERRWIQYVANLTNVHTHFTFPTGENLSKDLRTMIWHLDEPGGSSSSYAQWCVFRLAKQSGLTVMLDGQGSDELMAGYEMMVPIYAAGLFEQGRIMEMRQELKGWQQRNGLSSYRILRQTLAEVDFLSNAYRKLVHFGMKENKIDMQNSVKKSEMGSRG